MTTPIESQREVILCLLAGKSINRAANETGVPKGTISRLCKKQSFIDLMEQIKAENSKPKLPPKAAAKSADRAAVSVAVEVVDEKSGSPLGRPSLLSDARRNELVRIIRDEGLSVTAAAPRVGVSGKAANEWVRRGESRDGAGRPRTDDYAEFAAAVREAEAILEGRAVRPLVYSVMQHPDKRTKQSDDNAQWFLQRRFPERWGQTQSVNVQFEAKLSEAKEEIIETIYAAVSASPRIPEEMKPVFYEVMAGVTGNAGELVEGAGTG
jgi:transposase